MVRRRSIPKTGAFERAARFLGELGFEIRVEPEACGFLKGIEIRGGALLVEAPDDDIAGELLHEAGHLAVMPSLFRGSADGDLEAVGALMGTWIDEELAGAGEEGQRILCGILQAGECEAVAWSFAAAHAIGLDTRIPFYRGFSGEGLELHDQVASGRYFGVHGLAAAGMTELKNKYAKAPFPEMKRWLQV